MTLPWQLNIRLVRDIVVLLMDGKRVALTMRLDVPPPDIPLQLPHLDHVQASSAIVVSYGVEVHEHRIPGSVEVVVEAVRAAGYRIHDVFCVTGDEVINPCEGTSASLAEVSAAVAAPWVALGRNPVRSRRDLVALLEMPDEMPPDSGDEVMTGAAWQTWSELILGETREQVGESEWRNAAAALRDDGFFGALLELASPTLLPTDEEVAGEGCPDGLLGVVEETLRLLPRTPVAHRPRVLTLLGAIAWELGDGMTARAAMDRALIEDGQDDFAKVLWWIVDQGIRPGRSGGPGPGLPWFDRCIAS